MTPKNLKIALGMNLQKGPFGGGNRFGKALAQYLRSKNAKVVYELKDKDIDIILLTETRKWLESCAFDMFEVIKYIWKKPDTLVVFRVNECDERKGAKIKLLNKSIIENMKLADLTVFISHWLKNLFLLKEQDLERKSLVIYNGGDTNIFNAQGYKKWKKGKPLRIVTHHWGANWNKGFDIYLTLDDLIRKKFKSEVHFTFIGNTSPNIKFKNTKIISPQNSKRLVEEIKRNHIYLTASICEPAGMHHIEGALCGLPLLYRNSGALPEYCQGFGIAFEGSLDFEKKLLKIMEKYDYFVKKMPSYNKTAERMSENYYQLFLSLMYNKKNILNQRKVRPTPNLSLNKFFAKACWLKEKTNTVFKK